jgi:tetratricopeptide (TPR) repeat protein
MRYVAFLSYSHRNKAETQWLHRALERYYVPQKLVGRETPKGPVPRRLIPIFRDRDELSASADLGADLRAALASSDHLIVIASPASARSPYVEEEIRTFKALNGEARVFALIVDGEPYASGMAGREAEEAFPRALRLRVGADGALTDTPAEPIAADIRPGKDGRRLALMKLVAGITGLRLDDLVQREAQRRARRLTILASLAGAVSLVTSALAIYANRQRLIAVEQREIAERETAAARAATDYLIGTFELSNPATENPRTVSLVTILERAAERARGELREQPAIEARIVTAVGRAYNNLGLLDEAEIALARALPAIKRAGPEGSAALVTLATTLQKKGEFEQGLKRLDEADLLLGPDGGSHPTLRAEVAAARGGIAYVNVEPEKALAEYDRALALLAREPAPDPRIRADLLLGRGRILNDLGRYEEAEASLMEAKALFVRYRGPNHLSTGRTLFALALVAYSDGRLAEAESRIRASLRTLARMLDQSNPIRADALSLLGSILQGEGRLADADRALAQAVAAYNEVYKGPHYNIGIAEFYRAQVAADQGRVTDALAHLDEAQRNYEASYGKTNANIGELMVTRARYLRQVGKEGEARAQCGAGLQMLDATVGPSHSFTRGLRATCESLFSRPS